MNKIKNVARRASAKVVAVASTVAMAAMPAMAFAQESGIKVGTQVTSLVNEYKEEALIAIGVMIVAGWTLKATGILKPRG